MKRRLGFVSNSSSSSFVIIDGTTEDPRIAAIYEKGVSCEEGDYKSDRIVIPWSFPRDAKMDFGWSPEDWYGFEDKLSFACLQACYHDGVDEKTGTPVLGEFHGMIEKVLLEKFLFAREVEFSITTHDSPMYRLRSGYIDHESAYPECGSMFESKESLRDFLFGEKSYVHTDNDNH